MIVKSKKGSKKGSKKTRLKKSSKDMRFSKYRGEHESIKNVIMEIVQSNPQSTLMEIFKLVESDFNYSRAQVGNILRSMEGSDLKNISKNSIPRYEIIDTSEFKIQNNSYSFKDQICHNNLNVRTTEQERDMIKEHEDFRKDTMVDMILRLGLISYYTCLSSFEKGISPKLNNKQNKELQRLWLRNAMSLENNLNDGRPSTHVLTQIESNIDTEKRISWEDGETDIEPDFNEDISENISEAKKLKKIFAELFPDWYESFQEDEKITENMKEKLRKVCVKHPEYLLK